MRDAVPEGGWLSNILSRRRRQATTGVITVSLTWQPDPSIPVEEPGYTVFLRTAAVNQNPPGQFFSFENNVSFGCHRFQVGCRREIGNTMDNY